MTYILQAIYIVSSCLSFQITHTVSDVNCKGHVGKRPTTFDVASDSILNSSGLFLDTNHTSTCNGTVVAWEFCYYVNMQIMDMELLKIHAGVWRPQGMEYQLVDNSLTDLPISMPDSGLQFVCRQWSVNSGETFDVTEGDIAGMYVKEESNKRNLVHILGMPISDEAVGGVMKVVNVTNITSVSYSQLDVTSYSLYLMAVIGNFSEFHQNETSSTQQTPSDSNGGAVGLGDQKWYLVIAILSAFILLLIIFIIFAIVCKLCGRPNRCNTRGSEPLLIKYVNGRLTRIVPRIVNPGRHENEHDVENSFGTQTVLSRPTTTSHQPLVSPPSAVLVAPLTPPTVPLNDEQQSDIDIQHGIEEEQNLQQPSYVYTSVVKRCHSADDILNSVHTSNYVDDEEVHMSSVDYPYVLHTFEVIGKQKSHIGSLPNMSEHHTPSRNCNQDVQHLSSNDNANLSGNKQNNPTVHFVSIEPHYIDADDEPSYSYADKRTVLQNTATCILMNGTKPGDSNHEHPSTWIRTEQHTLKNGEPTKMSFTETPACKNPVLQVIESSMDIPDEQSVESTQAYTKLLTMKSAKADDDSDHYTRLKYNNITDAELSLPEPTDCEFEAELSHPKEWYNPDEC